MTDEEKSQTSEIASLRDEFQTQFDAMKQAFEQSSKEKDEEIAALKENNTQLKAALLKSTFTERPAEEAPKEKSQEELYAEQVDKLYQKSKLYQESI